MSGDKRLLCSNLFPVFLFQLEQKQVVPPFKPNISGEFGLDNFDAQFTNEPIQLTPDDEWVSICTFYSSYWELTIILVIDVPFCPLQRRGEEDWPVWVWRVWVHQPTPHVSRGVCLRDRSVVCAETHPPPHKHTHTHIHPHHLSDVVFPRHRSTWQRDKHICCTCTVERLFAKTSLTLCHL